MLAENSQRRHRNLFNEGRDILKFNLVGVPYPVSHRSEPRDFVMFSFMTCDCSLVLLGLAFESATLSHFSEKPTGSMGWESGYKRSLIQQRAMVLGSARWQWSFNQR